mmetsp:Transcript_65461/g.142761  ORF Transcript_65461/g.142761 Transcript_65461/m.142761 type:complete len:81 (-) Transcript_65461:412-654(-)
MRLADNLFCSICIASCLEKQHKEGHAYGIILSVHSQDLMQTGVKLAISQKSLYDFCQAVNRVFPIDLWGHLCRFNLIARR